MSAIDEKPFPRGALIGTGALLAFTLLAAGVGVSTRDPPPPIVAASAVRDLAFSDEPNGAVTVRDGAGALVTTLQPGADGFVRTVLRTLVRERRARGVAEQTSFRLTRWADGTLTIEDAVTGKRIELTAFGPTNRAAFERLLEGA